MAKGMTRRMDVTVGRLRARLVGVAEAGTGFALRARTFRGGATDLDGHDRDAQHLLVEDGGVTCGYARIALQRDGTAADGYAGGRYDLATFARVFPRAVEVGRICLAPERDDPQVLRLMLAMLARLVGAERAQVLHGCASLSMGGCGSLALTDRIAPEAWRPRPRAAETAPLTALSGPMPPLLRMWLALGASVSDHAVFDRDLGTLHVHTALPVAAIPRNRAQRLAGLLSDA
ncbi:GNAT family N-acetyltransferase [uncultured Jannaschia sp.]|uniref:GNAT family N-acetyltransferase n=1 Tax=uncultured Jannaschia sp. TaxID=293347 RepID=UPI0026131C22|nr:GNAT family N-acetyltransferase [uncultured Jannaschia sp.]